MNTTTGKLIKISRRRSDRLKTTSSISSPIPVAFPLRPLTLVHPVPIVAATRPSPRIRISTSKMNSDGHVLRSGTVVLPLDDISARQGKGVIKKNLQPSNASNAFASSDPLASTVVEKSTEENEDVEQDGEHSSSGSTIMPDASFIVT